MDCSCHHAATEHAAATQCGTSICLVRDCDCDGTHEELAREAESRRRFLKAKFDRLVEIIAAYVPDKGKCELIASAILRGFDMEIP